MFRACGRRRRGDTATKQKKKKQKRQRWEEIRRETRRGKKRGRRKQTRVERKKWDANGARRSRRTWRHHRVATATDRRRSFSHRRLGLYPFFLFSTIGPSSLPLVRAATCYYYTHAAVCVERPRLWSRRVRVSKFPDAFRISTARRRRVSVSTMKRGRSRRHFRCTFLIGSSCNTCKTELVAGGLDSTARLTFQEASVSLSIVRSRYSVPRAELGCRGRRRGGERERGKKTTSCPFRVTRDIFTYLSPPPCRKTKRQRGKERRRKRSKLQCTKNNEANSVCSSREVHSRIL